MFFAQTSRRGFSRILARCSMPSFDGYRGSLTTHPINITIYDSQVIVDTIVMDTDMDSDAASQTKVLLRYALYSRLAYFDFDVTTDDLCVVGQHGCITKVKFIDKADTQLWIFVDNARDELVIAFRGSDSMGDILTNFCIIPDSFLVPNHGTCHGGHMKCYKTVRNEIMMHVRDFVKSGGKKVTVCGHSLGGACASICALDIALSSPLQVSCYSYGALAFADRKFCESLRHYVPQSYRIVHANDFAPFIPMLFYRHYDDSQTCISISTAHTHPYIINTDTPLSSMPSPFQTLHSKAMHYIRHHSIESYIAGLRRLSKLNNASHNHNHHHSKHSKPKTPRPLAYKNLTPPIINTLTLIKTPSFKHVASTHRFTNVFSRPA
jgi:hypothetical protein